LKLRKTKLIKGLRKNMVIWGFWR